MSTIPTEKPNRIMPQSPPDVRPPRPEKFSPCPPETEPCPPDIVEPDRGPPETPSFDSWAGGAAESGFEA